MSINIKWHNLDELEEIARQIHQKYQCEVPIDIDYIVEMIGLELCEISRLKKDFGLYGLLAKVKGAFTIYVQKGELKSTNYYTTYTIAEELSHYILHKEYFKNINDFNGAVNFYENILKESDMMMELNAKYLAGAILVPCDSLREKAFSSFKRYKKILFKTLKDDFDSVIDKIASLLNDYYQVPESTISYRLKRRFNFKNFLKQEYEKYIRGV